MYKDFILMLQPFGSRPKDVWFQADAPISFDEATDRIEATGAMRGFRAGGYGEGEYMISIDPREIDLHRRAGRTPVRLRTDDGSIVRRRRSRTGGR